MPKVTIKKFVKPPKSTKVSSAGASSSIVAKVNDHTAINRDRELLLRAFEKPTKIYRFMQRNQRPFLYRTLSYMPERKPVRKQLRKSFEINNMMNELQKRKLYFILQFTGIFDKSLSHDIHTAQVGISLLKKLRQESEKKQMLLGYVSVPVNPGKNCPFKESAKLIVSDKSDANSSLLSLCFNVRLSNKAVDCDTASSDSDVFVENNKRKSLRFMPENEKKLIGDIQLFDKRDRLIPMGRKLEATLIELSNSTSSTTPNILTKKSLREHNQREVSENCNQQQLPILQFYIYRNEKDVIKPQMFAEKRSDQNPTIIYQFHYNNNSKQHSKSGVALQCLWCSLNCMSMNGLFMHLKLCHLRFHFTFSINDKGAKVEVYPNDQYNGSYEGSPYDLLVQHPGSAFSRLGPMKRTPITEVLVHSKKIHKWNESVLFMSTEDSQRSFVDGRNRLYYHSATCLPIYPDEYDIDSENENDPEWLRERTKMMIDDFTDVNGGEKSIMKMWNLHLLRHKFVGDCYIPVACATFIEEYGKEIIERQLYRNFLIHLATLVDFGLLNDFYYYTLVVQLQRRIVTNPEYIQQFRTSYLAQRHYAYLYGNQNISGSSQYDGNGEVSISNDDRAETSSLIMSSSPITRRKLPDQNRKRGI